MDMGGLALLVFQLRDGAGFGIRLRRGGLVSLRLAGNGCPLGLDGDVSWLRGKPGFGAFLWWTMPWLYAGEGSEEGLFGIDLPL